MQGLGAVGLRMEGMDAEVREIMLAAKAPDAKLLHLRNRAMQLLFEAELATKE